MNVFGVYCGIVLIVVLCYANGATWDPVQGGSKMKKKERTWDFDSVDTHISRWFLEDLKKDVIDVTDKKKGVAIPPDVAIKRICEVYKVVRPILKIVSEFSLLPRAWKQVVGLFIRVLDALCPGAVV